MPRPMPPQESAPKTYEIAESVKAMASNLIANYHPELATARILYIFVSKGGTKSGRKVFGKVRKLAGALEFLLEHDFMIEMALDVWNDMDAQQRAAGVDHLLERCFGEESEQDGSMSWKVRDPDAQEFATILQRHGAWNETLTSFVSVAQQIGLDDIVEETNQELAQEVIQNS
jgi:hypothetical protein